MELSTRFNFKDVEAKWRKYWEDNKTFHAEPNQDKDPYTIVIPPPNVTGILHMGHALNNTLQDIIIRYKRMQGFEACWMPGTDHAGIATQNVVEKQLAKEGKTRYDVGREKLLERLWEWKQEYGDTIINQLKWLGSSCDWPRTRFTMDEGYSDAVIEVFVRLHEKGLIYRGQRIINWCPRCQTALSDEEAEHREQQGALYHIHYPIKNRKEGDPEYLTVATTRPETMLGDTAVAVNPDDPRYNHLIGKTLILPIIEREIKIIADEFVTPDFGTGAVKVTPAHDPNDFEMGTRHNLEFINIMHPNAELNENAGEDFIGMDRFEAREAIIEVLKERKLLGQIEPHTHAVGHCYRCHTVVEPYLSKQWFVKMAPLAEPALKVVQEGKVKFYPERWTKVYTNWLENIRDWCISRQIWWGHRIPAWYCEAEGKPECQEPVISKGAPGKCEHCGNTKFRQDEDVLDTWFSSWLWPFATFGWPENPEDRRQKTEDRKSDLEYFYPGDSLFTASEIIFFWVARMIMAGLEFMDDIPFKDVYIHGTVRDSKGRKMSKSLGNALDPLEIIEEYGADALRFSLIINSGQDLYISKEKFEIGRNFANKIWNATRFVLMNYSQDKKAFDLTKDVDLNEMDLPSQWIVSKFQSTLRELNRAIESYRFSEAESLIYDFFWSTYCDWYLEIIKDKLSKPNVQKVAFAILEQSLKMMHPFMPFVTEEIWEHLGISDKPVSLESWPQVQKNFINQNIENDMATLMDIVSSIRNLRSQWNIKRHQTINCLFATRDEQAQLIEKNTDTLKILLKIDNLEIRDSIEEVKDAAFGIVKKIKFCLPLGNLIDITEEKKRILAQIEEQKKASTGINKRLQNENFVKKAPKDVVAKEKERLESLEAKTKELETTIKNLE